MAVTSKWKLPNKFRPCLAASRYEHDATVLYVPRAATILRYFTLVLASKYRLGMRRYLLSAAVVHKYMPKAASYLHASKPTDLGSSNLLQMDRRAAAQLASPVNCRCVCWASFHLSGSLLAGSLLYYYY